MRKLTAALVLAVMVGFFFVLTGCNLFVGTPPPHVIVDSPENGNNKN